MAAQVDDTQKSPTLLERISMNGGFLPYLLVLPTIILILVIAVYPILNSIYLSFIENPLTVAGSVFVGFANYVHVLSDRIFLNSISTTLIFSVISVFFETLFGLGIALLINKTFPGRGLVRAAILVPWAFPTVVSAQMWLLMYNDQTGIITYILQGLHLVRPGDTLLGSSSGVILASVITDVWKTTPFMALLILAGLQVIPSDLYEAASVDGSTRWQQFWSITLPMLKNPLLIALLFRALDAIRAFDIFYVFGQRSVQSMATYANYGMFAGTAGDFTPGVAAAVIVFVFGIIISLIFVSMMRDVMRQVG
ncbi:sugar ABC transporter permease [Ktedonosporobacter rubrisoli]|uniref:Sugar ABC transporter permease n=1 Tax=Ktedonosporobacter rubrisoli TaxID=2509675 RepID=A0A4P6JZT3_KTERU|nr:sugar ABC transporter permease [Ktedonosporobacter rubrisoli]QBD81023.1 sugar ABC transporter permease [Ktedonosporobacter rubrisoli]